MKRDETGSCLAGRRILVVEDELLIAMQIENVLIHCGCSIVGTAPTIEKALDLIAREQPDAVTLDGNLKGQLSVPVAEMLNGRGIPYLLVTGYVELALSDPVLRAAPRVAKPFTHANLIHAAETAFC